MLSKNNLTAHWACFLSTDRSRHEKSKGLEVTENIKGQKSTSLLENDRAEPMEEFHGVINKFKRPGDAGEGRHLPGGKACVEKACSW